MNSERTIDRILKVVDTKINKYYDYNEPNISIVAKTYIKKYLSVTAHSDHPQSQLKILCTTSYLIAMKYLLDSAPLTKDYSIIVNVSTKLLAKKEMDIAKQFLFNFTPTKRLKKD